MEIRWTESAAADFDYICDYLVANESPSFSEKVGGAIYRAVASLGDFPEKGRPGREAGTRELVIQRHPHVVIYELKDGAVEILRVLHSSQQWP